MSKLTKALENFTLGSHRSKLFKNEINRAMINETNHKINEVEKDE